MFEYVYYLTVLIGMFGLARITYTIGNALHRNFLRKPHNFPERYGKDSWALVTGSTSGIGLALCKDLASKGMNVVLAGRNKERLDKAEAEVKAANGKVKTRQLMCDLNESIEISFYKDIAKQVEDLDISIFINNAGVGHDNTFVNTKEEELKDMLDTNLYGLTMLSKLFIDKMTGRKQRSAVINVASIAAAAPMPFFSTYSATKTFVRFLTIAVGEEVEDKIDMLSLSPGYVSTKMTHFKKSFDTCSPETCARNTLRDLGYENETNGFWIHEAQFWLVRTLSTFLPSAYYALINRVAKQVLDASLEKEKKTE